MKVGNKGIQNNSECESKTNKLFLTTLELRKIIYLDYFNTAKLNPGTKEKLTREEKLVLGYLIQQSFVQDSYRVDYLNNAIYGELGFLSMTPFHIVIDIIRKAPEALKQEGEVRRQCYESIPVSEFQLGRNSRIGGIVKILCDYDNKPEDGY